MVSVPLLVWVLACLIGLRLFVVNPFVVSRWRGDYGGKKQLWFPANYVEEVPSSPIRELDEAVS